MAKKYKNDLERQYHTLAMRADRRMLRLERLAAENNDYQGVLDYSYKKAASMARAWGSKSDKPRFDIKAPASAVEIKDKIKDIQAFLDAPTSTKGQIDRIYKQRANTFNTNYGTSYTWQEFGNMFKWYDDNMSDKRYGSKTVARALVINTKLHTAGAYKSTEGMSEEEKLKRKERIEDIMKEVSFKPSVKKVLYDISAVEDNGNMDSLISDLQKTSAENAETRRSRKANRKGKKKKKK